MPEGTPACQVKCSSVPLPDARLRLYAATQERRQVRCECLNIKMFWSLAQARVVISDWKADYNHRRPHSAVCQKFRITEGSSGRNSRVVATWHARHLDEVGGNFVGGASSNGLKAAA